MDTCLVYLPRPPRLCRLNLGAWLILELCDGRSEQAMGEAYVEATGGSDRAGSLSQLASGLDELVQLGLVQKTGADGTSVEAKP